jgi:transcription termination factor Rho
VTETPTTTDAAAPAAPRKTSGSLGGKVLAELQEIAADLGITGAEKMRKGALIDAIKIARGDAGTSTKAAVKAASAPVVDPTADAVKDTAVEAPRTRARKAQPTADATVDVKDEAKDEAKAGKADEAKADKPVKAERPRRKRNDAPKDDAGQDDAPQQKHEQGREQGRGRNADQDRDKSDKNDKNAEQPRDKADRADDSSSHDEDGEGGNRGRNRNRNQGNQGGGNNQGRNQGNPGGRNQGSNQGNPSHQGGGNAAVDEDDEGNSRRRNRRGRNRSGGRANADVDTSYTEDDVLVPAAGILDILDNYAFVRTTGYLPSENDVYVSLAMVRKWGLRRGDAVVGQVRQPREGERKEKFNPMVKIDSVNGMTLEDANKRVEFSKLTPLYPSERLRLESDAAGTTGRVIDLVSPIGKGQRGLIVSPPKAGKTMIMQQIANAITTNNPECHLMIVLVDERPEEVTDFQRTVKGEVIASTFDRPATDHTMVAELAIERAKRLVELGHDVVVLLDGITRLGRAYNLAAPTSGRIMSGGVDSSALYPPKKFFGAARNIEDGGSLTILATALVETGSRMDEVIFEEFKGTGNWELRLRRDLADKRIFPAIDVDASSTRREELLMGADELAVVWKLRRVLSGLESQQGLELILDKLKKTSSNGEFLMSINKTIPQEGAASGS